MSLPNQQWLEERPQRPFVAEWLPHDSKPPKVKNAQKKWIQSKFTHTSKCEPEGVLDDGRTRIGTDEEISQK